MGKHNLQPIVLEAKEGLALINGTQAMTAQGVVNWLEAESLAYQSEWIAAMTMEALTWNHRCFSSCYS